MTCFVSQLYKMNSSIAAKLFCRIQLQRPSFKVFIGTASSEWVTRRNGFSTRIQAVNFSGGFLIDKNSILRQSTKRPKELTNESIMLYGTRSSKPLSSRSTANQFVRWLLPEERATLYAALQEFRAEEGNLELPIEDEPDPSFKQLKLVAFCNAIPFIGFGLLDNGIMILAGEYIDHTIGLTLGISTMAAAAIGNLISDIMGLGLAGYVEVLATRLGFEVPPMTTRQASKWKTKYSAYLGRSVGIAIGCVLGMFPLLFINPVEEDGKEHPKQNELLDNKL